MLDFMEFHVIKLLLLLREVIRSVYQTILLIAILIPFPYSRDTTGRKENKFGSLLKDELSLMNTFLHSYEMIRNAWIYIKVPALRKIHRNTYSIWFTQKKFPNTNFYLWNPSPVLSSCVFSLILSSCKPLIM